MLGEAFSSRYEKIIRSRAEGFVNKGKEEIEKAIPDALKLNSARGFAPGSSEGDGDNNKSNDNDGQLLESKDSQPHAPHRSSSCPQLRQRHLESNSSSQVPAAVPESTRSASSLPSGKVSK